jgi:MoaA/NifB/PqqE/SkfB family radical SAM enzyme
MINTIDSRRWAFQTVDDGLHAFDRGSGQNILVRNRHTAGLQRTAPRVLQIGLLTPCNLHCDFCYRDTSAPSRLDAPFVLDLLSRAAKWGVFEVAFGGGEPLLFRGFVDMVEELRQATPLGINFTTNGTLLTEDLLARLRKVVGEMRVSAYPDNRYRQSLLMARGMNIGVNWLVTPANVGMIEPFVYDFLERGARNVFLLGYKGHDSSLHLREQHFALLKEAVSRLQHLPLRLDVCWYPRLADLPHLFARTDCGAGDTFLVITPDRAVQPCSFHHERIPFETFEDLRAIHAGLRSRRPATTAPGCTRAEFVWLGSQSRSVGVWFWQERAGNNSGDWTIVGRFREASDASRAAEALRELARAHEAFLASPEGYQWLIASEYFGNNPTPPLRKFGDAHGFDWTKDGDGLWWEEDGAGAPVLTVGAVGQTVVVYHPYCMGLPEEPFRKFFAAVGAVEFGYWQYDRPHVVARARGNSPAAIAAIHEHLALVGAAEYPSSLKTPPPWGAECTDPRVLDDEDRGATLDKKEFHLEQLGDRLTLLLSFQNTFAGALALEAWLKFSGYSEVTIAIEQSLDSLGAAAGPPKEPATKLFGDLRPLADRLTSMTPPEMVETLFGFTYNVPHALDQAIAKIPLTDWPTWDARAGRVGGSKART